MIEQDDLLKENSDSNKLTKVLIIGGSAFIIFVVVVVIYKFVSGDDVSQTKVILPPEIKKESTLFKDVTISDIDNDITEETKIENKTEKPVKKFDDVLETTETKKIEEPKKIEIEEAKTIEPVKKEITKPVKNEIAIPVETKKPVEKVTTKAYFIQVAALTKNSPSKKFLDLIKRENFNYKVLDTNININGKTLKVKKVLIGPYKTYEDAKKDLNRAKKSISSGAFILKV
jgi:DedD protein